MITAVFQHDFTLVTFSVLGSLHTTLVPNNRFLAFTSYVVFFLLLFCACVCVFLQGHDCLYQSKLLSLSSTIGNFLFNSILVERRPNRQLCLIWLHLALLAQKANVQKRRPVDQNDRHWAHDVSSVLMLPIYIWLDTFILNDYSLDL